MRGFIVAMMLASIHNRRWPGEDEASQQHRRRVIKAEPWKLTVLENMYELNSSPTRLEILVAAVETGLWVRPTIFHLRLSFFVGRNVLSATGSASGRKKLFTNLALLLPCSRLHRSPLADGAKSRSWKTPVDIPTRFWALPSRRKYWITRR